MIDKSKAKQIADAFVWVATANHYMVGFNYRASREELEMAYQILIIWDNDRANSSKVIQLALNLIEQEIKGCKL